MKNYFPGSGDIELQCYSGSSGSESFRLIFLEHGSSGMSNLCPCFFNVIAFKRFNGSSLTVSVLDEQRATMLFAAPPLHSYKSRCKNTADEFRAIHYLYTKNIKESTSFEITFESKYVRRKQS